MNDIKIVPYCSEPNVRHEILPDGNCAYCNKRVKNGGLMATVYYCNQCEKYTKDMSHKHKMDLLYIGSIYSDADQEVWNRWKLTNQTV